MLLPSIWRLHHQLIYCRLLWACAWESHRRGSLPPQSHHGDCQRAETWGWEGKGEKVRLETFQEEVGYSHPTSYSAAFPPKPTLQTLVGINEANWTHWKWNQFWRWNRFLLQPKTKPPNSATDKAMYTALVKLRVHHTLTHKSVCEKELLKPQVRKHSRASPISPFSLITGSTNISMNPKGNFLCSPLPTKHWEEKELSCAFAQTGFGF